MARLTPKGPTPVESFRHDETRLNIPTADAAATFYDEEAGALQPLRYPRDPSLDPQLVWRGKDDQDGEDLLVDAPPIYIQEKIDPRALIENLRQTGSLGEREPEFTLFDSFDELDGLDGVEYYQHDESWKNRMILGDSLQVMSSLAEREALRGKVQMIYVDPPYGIKFGSNWQVRTSKREVKDGGVQDAAREAEQIKAFRDTWELGIHSYLAYLRDRLVVARDLLTQSGSVFVQIGDENVHLVRSLLDEVFGSENYVSQISYKTTTSATSLTLASITDYILWYAKDVDHLKFRRLYTSKVAGEKGATQYTFVEHPDGTRESIKGAQIQPGDRVWAHDQMTSQSGGATTQFEVRIGDKTFFPSSGGWKTNSAGMERLRAANRLWPVGNTLRYVRYLDDFPAVPIPGLWEDTVISGFGDSKVYVVQTLTTVIARCVLLATDPGDLVLDPTCGSGTTAHVAEHWGRRWVTIDTSRVAIALARQRIMGAKYPYYVLADTDAGRKLDGLPPASTSGDIRKGFSYQKLQHVTLKSIATDPDIVEGMTTSQIDAVVKKNAEYEVLFDKPKEDKSKVRVAGPFTVESLSPHRSLSFDEVAELGSAASPDQHGFETTIIDNLRTAGIQNGRRNERLEFTALEPHAGEYVQAIGERRSSEGDGAGAVERIAVAIGPQYGTVGPGFIKAAVKEAVRAETELVAVLGFAFDPQSTGVVEIDGVTVVSGDAGFAVVESKRTLGRVQVLFVRMNVDLLMGEELKKSKTGNLFTVFGEPDIDVRDEGGKVVVQLKGVDVYDPTSGDVRSSSTGEIALWMVDTNYDEESFFVRHAYFTGDNDPFKQLKTALKADIDPEAWFALYRTTSMPFDPPSTGKIAVKVINDYGDEVMKVIQVV